MRTCGTVSSSIWSSGSFPSMWQLPSTTPTSWPCASRPAARSGSRTPRSPRYAASVAPPWRPATPRTSSGRASNWSIRGWLGRGEGEGGGGFGAEGGEGGGGAVAGRGDVAVGDRFDDFQVGLEFGFGAGGADHDAHVVGVQGDGVGFGEAVLDGGDRAAQQLGGRVGAQPGHRRGDLREVVDAGGELVGGVQAELGGQLVQA